MTATADTTGYGIEGFENCQLDVVDMSREDICSIACELTLIRRFYIYIYTFL